MGIISIVTNTAGQGNVNPRRVKIITTDSLATVTATGYLNQVHNNGYPLLNTDVVDMDYLYNPLTRSGTYGVFTVSVNGGIVKLSQDSNEGEVILPVFSGHVAVFSGTSGTIADGTAAPVLAITSGNGNSVKFNGTLGQLADAGYPAILTHSSNGQNALTFLPTATTDVSALSGTLSVASDISSGVFCGISGEVGALSADSGFTYGVKGKVIIDTFATGGARIAAIFGELDLSTTVLTSATIALIWGDMGSVAEAGTGSTVYGLVINNDTLNVPNALIRLTGGGDYLLELDDHTSTVGSTYFANAGTTAGSAGDVTKCNASKTLKIHVNGVNYWLPLFASNS